MTEISVLVTAAAVLVGIYLGVRMSMSACGQHRLHQRSVQDPIQDMQLVLEVLKALEGGFSKRKKKTRKK